MRLLKRKAVVVVMALAMVVGTSAAAFAYWTSGGVGTGSASTASPGGIVTANQTSTVTGLFPGGPAAELKGNFTNNNDGSVFVHQVQAEVTGVSDPECGTENFALDPATATVDRKIPRGEHVSHWDGIEISLLDTELNQDDCKNVTVTISYTVS
jgi:hypothetical protein